MYRILATTLLAGVGLLLSRPALAQVTFSPPTGASLQPSADFRTLESADFSTLTVTPDADLTGTLTLTVSAPVLQAGQPEDPANTNARATVSFNGTTVSSDDGSSGVLSVIDSTNLEVSMRVTRPVPYPPGPYTYRVGITVTYTED